MKNESLSDLLIELRDQGLMSNDVYNTLYSDYQQDDFAMQHIDWDDVRMLFFSKNPPKDEFEVEPMNSANLCPTFFPVLESINTYRKDFNQDISIQNRVKKFSTCVKYVKQLIASQLNVEVENLAFVRNTSEANNLLSGGFKRWKSGTEILLWDENHPTNNAAWKLKASHPESIKYFSMKDIKFDQPDGDEQVKKDIIKEITSKIDPDKTIMLSFSHVSNASGIQLPADEIIKAVRAISRNIHIHVDGAMTWGSKTLNLKAMDCDSYSSSSHKWFMGPFETGLLYMKKERCEDFRINIFGYDGKVEVPDLDKLPKNARRFELLGQRDEANIYAMGKTAEYHQRINGRDSRVQNRILELQRKLINQLEEKIPNEMYSLSFLTPKSPTFSNGIVFFKIMLRGRDIDHGKLNDFLYAADKGLKRFAVATTLKKDYLRICPHIMNLESNITDVVNEIVDYLRMGMSEE